MINFFFDMETNDPDDVFALALLATHPRSNLVGVTLHPGGADQVGLVRHILKRLNKDIPIGADALNNGKKQVSEFHYRWLGNIQPESPTGTSLDVINESLKAYDNVHLVTGAALSNIANAQTVLSRFPGNRFFTKWTCQGGFAGDNIVPPEHRLPKFAGKNTCPTYNLGGDFKAAEQLLSKQSPFHARWMVSKNVCHGVFWTPAFNNMVPSGKHLGLDLIKEGMDIYFHKKPDGKALHDVIAAAAALSPAIGNWAPVWPYREKGAWGCLSTTDSDAPKIMISLNNPEFLKALSE